MIKKLIPVTLLFATILHAANLNSKDSFQAKENVIINFTNMEAKNQDWIGIYPKESNNDWANVIAWKWTNDVKEGKLDFGPLAARSYEARAFYNDSLKLEARREFKVNGNANANNNENGGEDHILYDNMENGLDKRWVKYAGNAPAKIIKPGAQGSANSIRVRARSGYYFDFGRPATKLKFLAIDTRIGVASHIGNFGVLVKTKKGNRRIIFSSYMNHPGNRFNLPPAQWDKPFISENGYQHNHPGPTDYFMETKNRKFIHYKINIDAKLKILEPDNEIVSILLFTTAGGDFDNIALSAN